jgi:hypothetical protein
MGVQIENKSGPSKILADCLIDCTGDGDLAARAGAEHELGRRGDGVMQPMTMLFFLSHVNVPEAEQAKVLTRQPWNVVEPERLVGKVNSYRLDLARGVTISVLGPDGLQASARSDFQTPRDRS